MDQKANEAVVDHVFELFDTGEEAIRFLDAKGLEGNEYLLKDMESLCAAIASAVEQLIPQIKLNNKLKEIGLNAPLTLSRIRQTLGEGKIENAHMQYACSFAPLFLFWRRYAEFFLLRAVNDKALEEWYEQERERIRRIREMPKQDEYARLQRCDQRRWRDSLQKSRKS